MCIFFFLQLNSNVFAFAIIELKSLGDQEIFSPQWGGEFPGLL